MAKRRKYNPVDKRVGLAPSQRTIDKFEKNANQWTITPQQIKFVELWLTPKIDGEKNKHFGDAYTSAIEAGFSDSYARRLTARSMDIDWVAEARKRLISFKPEHTVKQLEELAMNSRKDADRIRSLEILARIQGMFIDRSINTNIDVKFTNDIPRPIIDATGGVGDKDSTT